MSLSVVKAVIENHDGKILVLQKAADHDSFMAGQWELPGGKQEKDETVQETVRRECRTETGLGLTAPDEIVTMRIDEPTDLTCVIVHAIVTEEQVILSAEHQDHQWVEPEMFRDLDLHRDAKYAIPIIEHLETYK